MNLLTNKLKIFSLSLLVTAPLAMEQPSGEVSAPWPGQTLAQQLSAAEKLNGFCSDINILHLAIRQNWDQIMPERAFNPENEAEALSLLNKIKIVMNTYVRIAFRQYYWCDSPAMKEEARQSIINNRERLTRFFIGEVLQYRDLNAFTIQASDIEELQGYITKLTFNAANTVFLPLPREVGTITYSHWEKLVTIKNDIPNIDDKINAVKEAYGEEEAELVLFWESLKAFLNYVATQSPRDAAEIVESNSGIDHVIQVFTELGLLDRDSMYYAPSYSLAQRIIYSSSSNKFLFPQYLIEVAEDMQINIQELASFEENRG